METNQQKLQRIVDDNQSIIARLNSLNARGGDLPVPSSSEIRARVLNALNGAHSISEIPNLDDLRLPAVDAAIEARILRDNPDTITVCNTTFTVVYQNDLPPQIMFTPAQAKAELWRQLPDTCITLLSGRIVMVNIEFSEMDRLSSSNTSVLKERCDAHLFEAIFKAWLPRAPRLNVPTVSEFLTATIPAIKEVTYDHTANGTPLIAYGVVVLNPSFYSIEKFKAEWFQSKEHAETERQRAMDSLAAMREEHNAIARKAELNNTVDLLRQKLTSFKDRQGPSWFDLPNAKRSQFACVIAPISRLASIAELESKVAASEALMTELEATFKPAKSAVDALATHFNKRDRTNRR